jgi:inositol-pentakisphosphate 2-kinase
VKKRRIGSGVNRGHASAAAGVHNERPQAAYLSHQSLQCFQYRSPSEQETISFVNTHVAPLLSPRFVPRVVPVPVTREFLQQLAARTNPKRPTFRAQTTEVDPECGYVYLMRDLSVFALPQSLGPFALLGSSYAEALTVEVKPKWGFLPRSAFVSEATAVKLRVCRFCMHQALKHARGQVHRVSAFCPLDLYSGRRERVERALWALLEAPQNNLKLYAGGRLVYTGSLGGRPELAAAAWTLEHLPETLAPLLRTAALAATDRLVRLVARIFLAEPLLRELRAAQLRDRLDVEGIHQLHLRLEALGEEALREDCLDLPLELEPSFAERLLRTIGRAALTRREAIALVRDFLLAATFKDCSILITLRALHRPPEPHVPHIIHFPEDDLACGLFCLSYPPPLFFFFLSFCAFTVIKCWQLRLSSIRDRLGSKTSK